MIWYAVNRLRWVFLSTMVGLFAGFSASVFLFVLDRITALREAYPQLIWGLPLGGLLSGYLYWRLGKNAAGGSTLIIEAVHDPEKVVPFRMAPLILVGTVLTHLFGGSAGREGAAVQMSASLSAQLSRWFHIRPEEKKILLMAGTGAGFGATVGAPWAGFIFGLEVIRLRGGERFVAVLECWVASFFAYSMTRFIHAPHLHLPKIALPEFQLPTLLGVVVAGLCFGLVARAFVLCTHFIQNRLKLFPLFPPLGVAGMGMLLPVLYLWEGSLRYAGLGSSVIQQAFESKLSIVDPFYKLVFTALTVGGGFKGGEFVPLVFMGATLGNVLGQWLALPTSFVAALGYVAVFGGAAKTPLACTCLAIELFGGSIGLYALIACGVSFWVAGDHGIYIAQKNDDLS